MLVPCYCGLHNLDPEHATYVKDGKPLCHPTTCERANLRVARAQQLNRSAHVIPTRENFDVV